MATRAKMVQRTTIPTNGYKESLGYYMGNNPQWSRYFKRIVNHEYVDVEDKGLYIYCNTRKIEYDIVKEVNFLMKLRGVCTDFASSIEQTVGGESAIRFVIEDSLYANLRMIGVFLIERKTLLLADISHTYSEEAEKIFRRIMDYLKKHKLIEPIRALPRKSVNRINNLRITLGADPEFELRKNGEVIFASEEPKFSVEGYTEAAWGLDGSRETVEGRPEVGYNPSDAVSKMRDLFSEVTEFDLSVKGDRYSSGGHLHVGGVVFELVDRTLLLLYDNQIGKPTESMNGKRRLGTGYYGMGKYETKTYGFEYRTPPAGIFYNPRLLELCYKIMQKTAQKWYSGRKLPFHADYRVNLVIWSDFANEEIEEYELLIKEYQSKKDDNVVGAWVGKENLVPRKPKCFPVNLGINDDFSHEIHRDLIRAVRLLNTSGVRKRVSIYGLHRDRGNVVAGVYLDGFKTIPHPKNPEENRNHMRIGLAREIRELTSSREYNVIIKEITKQIVRYLKCV